MCREQLPVWQNFYETHRQSNFELLAVAMDAQGAEVARRFTQAAGARFTTGVDRAQGLWELYGFRVVPNVFFVDEQGIVRHVTIGGFDIRDSQDALLLERLLASAVIPPVKATRKTPSFGTIQEGLRQAEKTAQREPGNIDLLLALAERRVEAKQHAQARRDFEAALQKNPGSVRALMGLAAVYLDQGEREKASATLKRAWALEPDNWIIRKQIWAVEHPEQFYPAINLDWQAGQIKKEDAERK